MSELTLSGLPKSGLAVDVKNPLGLACGTVDSKTNPEMVQTNPYRAKTL